VLEKDSLVGGLRAYGVTAWLLIRGSKDIGPHLNLLGNFFPGYAVTWPGAFIGFGYAFMTGAVARRAAEGWRV